MLLELDFEGGCGERVGVGDGVRWFVIGYWDVSLLLL